MKKYSAILISAVIIVMSVIFASCGIKNGKKSETAASGHSNAQLDSSDLPTVTDENGSKVDYSVGVTGSDEESDTQSPYLSVDSLDDINAGAGTNIKSPKDLKVTNEEFDLDDTVSPKIASYSFMVDGKDYTVKASRKTGAMLINIYLPDGTPLGEGLEDTQSLPPSQYDGFCAARWFDDGVQYNLFAQNVTLSEFKTVYSKIK